MGTIRLTAAQKRAAFYKAAANIEARPDLYDFTKGIAGEEGCPACMWGHVARVIGLPANTPNLTTADYLNVPMSVTHRDSNTVTLYEFGGADGNFYPLEAAAKMRAFADHLWPADDLQSAGLSFDALIQSLQSEVTR